MEQAMIERGRGEGIEFSYGGNVSQTTDSHRLIEKSRELKGEEGQVRLVERCVFFRAFWGGAAGELMSRRLFKTYFEEEGDPGSLELLSRDAETAEIMSKDEVRLRGRTSIRAPS